MVVKSGNRVGTHGYPEVCQPYCDACVRAKMRRFKTKKGAFKQQLKKWGDLVTFDFLTPERVGQLGIETDTNVFVE